MPEPKTLPAAIQKGVPELGEPYKSVAVVTWAPEVIKKTAWVSSSQTPIPATTAAVAQPVKQPLPLPLPPVPPAPTPKAKAAMTPAPTKTSPTLFPLLQATKKPVTQPPVPTKPTVVPAKPAPMLTNPLKFLVKPATETPDIAPVSTPASTMPVTQVKSLVEKRCGTSARVANVRYLPDGNLEIRMAVASDATAPQIFDQIMSIPELAPYRMKVRFDAAQ
jgi:hypothetical protein